MWNLMKHCNLYSDLKMNNRRLTCVPQPINTVAYQDPNSELGWNQKRNSKLVI